MLWRILTGFVLLSAIIKAGIDSNESKTIGVALVGAPVNGNKTIQALELVLSFVNNIILSEGWKMEVRLLPSENDNYLLQDVTGSGLYRIATNMDNLNIQAIVGPSSSTSAKLMHPYAVKKDVPHVLPFATDPALRQTKRFPLMVRLSPPDTYQTQAVLDILQFYGWECLSIITTDNDYGFGVEDALMTLAMNRRIKLEVVTRLKTERSYFVEEITQVLNQLRDLKAHPIAVATNEDSGAYLLQEAFQRGLVVSKNWVWILLDGLIAPGVLKVEYTTSNGDLQETNFDGLIGTRPAASGGNLLRDLKSFWDDRSIDQNSDFQNELGFGLEKYIDGMLSVAHGVEGYRSKHQGLPAKEFDGLQLRNAILRANASGLTSPLLFDPDGKINSTNYDILLSKSGKWTEMGDWKSVTKLNMSSLLFLNFSKSLRASRMNTPRPRQANGEESSDVPIVHVVTILEPPFVMLGSQNTSYKGEILSNRVYTDSVEFIFKSSGVKVATSIYNYLQSDPDRFMVSSTDEGLGRVGNGSYAFFWDSLVLDLEASKSNCQLQTVNVGFGGVAYAAAFTKNSPLKPVFSRNILRLKESGYMTVLWERYFSELGECIRQTTANDANYKRLQFEELAGVFYFVALSMGTGFVLLLMEWVLAGIQDVNSRDVSAPKSLREAIRIRLNRVQQDISQNWFPRKQPKIPSKFLDESILSFRRNTNHFSEMQANDINDSVGQVTDGHSTQRISSIRFKIPGEAEDQPPS